MKNPPKEMSVPIPTLKPLILREVPNPAAPANATMRRRLPALQVSASGANHARHHVPRQA